MGPARPSTLVSVLTTNSWKASHGLGRFPLQVANSRCGGRLQGTDSLMSRPQCDGGCIGAARTRSDNEEIEVPHN